LSGYAILVCGLLVASLPVVYLLVPMGVKVLMRRRFLEKARKSGSVCLTFDDGPDPQATPAVLALLSNYDVKATFFVVGEKIERHSDIVDAIIRAGHEVGGHGYSHAHPFSCGPIRSIAEVTRSDRAIGKFFAGREVSLYRPPFGKVNLFSLVVLWAKRKKLVFWDIDPRDYQQSSGESVAGYLIARLPAGNVILLHDGRTSSKGSSWTVTVSALKGFLEYAAENGVKFRTVGELVA